MFHAQPLASPSIPHGLIAVPDRQLFSSRDLDETRAMVGRVMKPHQLEVIGGSQRLDSRMHFADFGDVSLSRLRYGADVNISPGPLEDFYLVQMPILGHAHITSGSQEIESTPEVASVLSPGPATTMRWRANNDQLMVRIARPLMERALEAQLGRPIDVPLEFELGFRWRDSVAWRCLVSYLLEWSTQGAGVARHRLITAQMEQLVAATLLTAHAHNYSGAQPSRQSAILPRHVRRVQEYLQAHAHEAIRPEQLAELAGLSLRSLYTGFKDFCGVSPMQYLKNLRLDRAREELMSGAGSSSIAGTALRWGFAHLGRFSMDYKARFGESPSQTLRGGG